MPESKNIAALFTKISNDPPLFNAKSIALPRTLSSQTSQATICRLGLFKSFCIFPSKFSFKSRATTEIPSFKNLRTHAAPIPDAPPVTIAVLLPVIVNLSLIERCPKFDIPADTSNY